MAFQFLCPQGHLLQGEESQTGQQCKCPYCGSEFLVPSPSQAPPADTATSGATSAGSHGDEAWASEEPAAAAEEPQPAAFPGIKIGPSADSVPGDAVPHFGPHDAGQQSLLHIPCPNGHVLETPRDMLGEDAMCPYCQAQFRLRLEDSREHQQQRAEQSARREQKLGRAWMNWAIAAAAVVILGIIVLVVIATAD